MQTDTTPRWRQLSEELQCGYLRFDGEIAAWSGAYAADGGRIWCGKGCGNCCTLVVNCTLTEALLVAQTLSEAQAARLAAHVEKVREKIGAASDLKSWLRLHRRQVGACPFLEADGACGVYPVRPFACRSLFSTRQPDWCAVDFAELLPLERQAFMSGLDPAVVAFPSHYAAAPLDLGRQEERAAAEGMHAAFGAAITGNLPVLVWLVLQHRLDRRLESEGAAIADRLAAEELNHPLLIEVEQPAAGHPRRPDQA